jgi:hypothetical protein
MSSFIEQMKNSDTPQQLIFEEISQIISTEEQISSLQRLLMQALCKDPFHRLSDWSEIIFTLGSLQDME